MAADEREQPVKVGVCVDEREHPVKLGLCVDEREQPVKVGVCVDEREQPVKVGVCVDERERPVKVGVCVDEREQPVKVGVCVGEREHPVKVGVCVDEREDPLKVGLCVEVDGEMAASPLRSRVTREWFGSTLAVLLILLCTVVVSFTYWDRSYSATRRAQVFERTQQELAEIETSLKLHEQQLRETLAELHSQASVMEFAELARQWRLELQSQRREILAPTRSPTDNTTSQSSS